MSRVIAGRTVFLWSSLVAHSMLVIIAEGTYYAYGHRWLHTACWRSLLRAHTVPMVIAGGTKSSCGHCCWLVAYLWSLLVVHTVTIVIYWLKLSFPIYGHCWWHIACLVLFFWGTIHSYGHYWWYTTCLLLCNQRWFCGHYCWLAVCHSHSWRHIMYLWSLLMA